MAVGLSSNLFKKDHALLIGPHENFYRDLKKKD